MQFMPVLLGVFKHENARTCTCVAPDCDESPSRFVVFLFRGVVALPVCEVHGNAIVARGPIEVPDEGWIPRRYERPILAVPVGGGKGSKWGRCRWTLLREHCG